MKKRLVVISAVFFLVLSALFAGTALAQKPIHQVIGSQQQRIDQGIRSGALTRAEADILEGNLTYIRDTFNRMKADGTLTPREETRLRNMLQENSKQIYSKKHNLPVRRLY